MNTYTVTRKPSPNLTSSSSNVIAIIGDAGRCVVRCNKECGTRNAGKGETRSSGLVHVLKLFEIRCRLSLVNWGTVEKRGESVKIVITIAVCIRCSGDGSATWRDHVLIRPAQPDRQSVTQSVAIVPQHQL